MKRITITVRDDKLVEVVVALAGLSVDFTIKTVDETVKTAETPQVPVQEPKRNEMDEVVRELTISEQHGKKRRVYGALNGMTTTNYILSKLMTVGRKVTRDELKKDFIEKGYSKNTLHTALGQLFHSKLITYDGVFVIPRRDKILELGANGFTQGKGLKKHGSGLIVPTL